MLFFQLALLAGYGYAHFLASRPSASTAKWLHRALLFISVLALPIIPSDTWKPADGSFPIWRILALLTVTVGGPYFLLASTSPLLQNWFAKSHSGGVPYRFFALSNFGSMLALITYPFVIEPGITLHLQALLWSCGYAVFALLCFWLARDARSVLPLETVSAGVGPRWPLRFAWLALAACPSALLLAITNHITQNIAAIPFLWVLPLSLYLLSFILTFESPRWYQRRFFMGLSAVAIGSMGYAVAKQLMIRDLRVLLPIFTLGLFACCMVCHGELVRRKPAPQFLTSFYLMIALGGAIGGLFVAAFAPLVFPALFELPILLVVTPLVVLLLVRKECPAAGDRKSEWARSQFRTAWMASLIATIAFGGYLVWEQRDYLHDAELLVRNFYGALRVTDDTELGIRELAHGTINHGEQYRDPQRRRLPITYYAPKTGIGLLMTDLEKRGPVRLGVVGLGTGTMAAWGRAGDEIHFYEINPLVLQLARSKFTYLADSPATITITLGDARLSLERESSQQFDVLAVDAFSGDAIPVHLLTREAFRTYWRHLRPSGVLAIHTSNKFLDLAPPLVLLAHEFGKEAHLIESDRDESTRTFASDWVLIGSRELQRFPWIDDEESEIDQKPGLRPWTDDFSNLWQILD